MPSQPEKEHDIYKFGLFEKYGIELEYMIVKRDTLNVAPLCDRLIYDISGSFSNEVIPEGSGSAITWSNELALHVVEFKTSSPVDSIYSQDSLFQKEVERASSILDSMECTLMPTAMHPWMNPEFEFRIWPHGDREIYETFDSIFSCKGHGWSNLQSMHINLPFRNSDEFYRLHSAIRFLLPLITALTASSPVIEGKFSGLKDTRMDVYRTNCARIPSLTGMIIPEPVDGINDYKDTILNVIYKDLKAFPGSDTISEEWVNARGAIARFDRGTIEIRTADLQEFPSADLACAELIIESLKAFVYEKYCSIDELNRLETEILHRMLMDTIKYAEQSIIADTTYLKLLNMPDKPHTASEILWYLFERHISDQSPYRPLLKQILTHGSLAARICKSTGTSPSLPQIRAVYQDLSSCLHRGELYIP